MQNNEYQIPEPVELWDKRLYSLLKRKFKADKIRTRYNPEKDQIHITVQYTSLNCEYHKIIENVHDLILFGTSQEGFVRELYNVILADTKKLFF